MIEFIKVKKTFYSGDKKWSLGPIDLKINEGEAVSIVGPSGSGKSTLLHLTGLLLSLTNGDIVIFNEKISKMSEKKKREFRNNKIGFVFQDFFLFPEFTLIENVEMPLIIMGLSKKESREKAEKILGEVGLGHRIYHYPRQLSGGQLQRGAIARALIAEPGLILADEPTGNLDPVTGEKIIDLLRKLQKKRNTTLILATHDEKISGISSQVIRIENGEIVWSN